ncbi:MAG: hypothetical protein AB7G62_04735 [Magnetospirillum sp.]
MVRKMLLAALGVMCLGNVALAEVAVDRMSFAEVQAAPPADGWTADAITGTLEMFGSNGKLDLVMGYRVPALTPGGAYVVVRGAGDYQQVRLAGVTLRQLACSRADLDVARREGTAEAQCLYLASARALRAVRPVEGLGSRIVRCVGAGGNDYQCTVADWTREGWEFYDLAEALVAAGLADATAPLPVRPIQRFDSGNEALVPLPAASRMGLP